VPLTRSHFLFYFIFFIEKLQYFRSSLGGVALETIRSLEPSNANYKKTMNLLVNRCDNKDLHFQAHVQAIFGLKGVEKGSSKGLRELCDCMNSHLRAIRTLANTQKILDGLLIHIVTRKLDQRTREKLEEVRFQQSRNRWAERLVWRRLS